ncbi:hypothetical protein [Rhodococcus phage RGL3]|uniref:Uncharacterized protein n=1 Tax=Rhodococcus phage RGL3 TaxID=2922221 RepID=G9FHQ2_9CAUD|nr:hypothetical protein RoPhRGL3_gp60 [Rhodococcus phage RGL3]AEV52140.1 hypothetical protein [Rhodococcus phage RGL3]
MRNPEMFDLFRLASLSEGWFSLEGGECDAPTGFFALAEIRPDEPEVWLDLFDREGMTSTLEVEDMPGVYLYVRNSDGVEAVTRFDSPEEARGVFYELWTEWDAYEDAVELEAWAANSARDEEFVPLVTDGDLTDMYLTN